MKYIQSLDRSNTQILGDHPFAASPTRAHRVTKFKDHEASEVLRFSQIGLQLAFPTQPSVDEHDVRALLPGYDGTNVCLRPSVRAAQAAWNAVGRSAWQMIVEIVRIAALRKGPLMHE